ncbi:LIM-like protein linking chromatin modification to RNAi, Stc1 [Branchiostoma belcheri]|nr:LIM-like protein linking chromatin modification to RNAi, Stc1 [Branchiostoma belcheri]
MYVASKSRTCHLSGRTLRPHPGELQEHLQGSAARSKFRTPSGLRMTTVARPCLLTVLLVLPVCTAGFLFAETLQSPSTLPPWRLRGLIQCLKGSSPIGCDVFACLEQTCEAGGMHRLCKRLLDNGHRFNTQGQVFLKAALPCIARTLTGDLGLLSGSCVELQELVIMAESHCLEEHGICDVAANNTQAIKAIMPVQELLRNRPTYELIRSIMECDEGVRAEFRPDLTAAVGEAVLSVMNKLGLGCWYSMYG